MESLPTTAPANTQRKTKLMYVPYSYTVYGHVEVNAPEDIGKSELLELAEEQHDQGDYFDNDQDDHPEWLMDEVRPLEDV